VTHEPEQAATRKPAGPVDFTTTHWSLVLRVGHNDTPKAAAALEQLCRSYWFPIYAYICRRNRDPEAAKDLTQAFFMHLLDQNLVARAEPEKGRFRAFVLTLLKNFLINEHERGRAQKRGGGQFQISLDAVDSDVRYRLEPIEDQAPDRQFDQKWAQEILTRSLEKLRHDYEASGMAARFEALKPFLPQGHQPASYAETAVALGLSEPAAKSAIFTLRRRFADIFRREIAQTVDSPEDAEAEMRHLLAALA
jgi:RNA polymerase sigma-70 factor (ECF subfamily)